MPTLAHVQNALNAHVRLQAAGTGSKRKLASAVVVADDPDGQVNCSGCPAHAKSQAGLKTPILDHYLIHWMR